MLRVLFFLAAIIALLWLCRTLARQYRQRGRATAVKTLLLASAAILLLLALSGRVHWIGAALASALAALRFALPLLLRALPLLSSLLRQRAQAAPQEPEQASLTEREALEILGLQRGASREEIIASHRRLIQKLHPDRGGNDYLASRINRAKQQLLDQLKD